MIIEWNQQSIFINKKQIYFGEWNQKKKEKRKNVFGECLKTVKFYYPGNQLVFTIERRFIFKKINYRKITNFRCFLLEKTNLSEFLSTFRQDLEMWKWFFFG